MPAPDITALRAARPDLEERLALMESDNRATLGRNHPQVKDACFGVRIAHDGFEATRVGPGATVRQCSRGSECRGIDMLHARENESCRLILDPCPWCDEEPEGETAGEPRG
jgi:hypothetical protein